MGGSESQQNIKTRGFMIAVIPFGKSKIYEWGDQEAKNLKTLRGKDFTQKSLAEKVRELGGECSESYIRKLESPSVDSVSREMIENICNALGVGVEKLVTVMYIAI